MDIHIWKSINAYPYMDIHIWVPRDPWGGSMDTLGWDTLGGPMGPWDRWDLGTDGTWASRTPDTSSEDTSSKNTSSIPGPAQPSAGSPATWARCRLPGCRAWCRLPAAGPGACCRLPGRPFFGLFFWKNSKNCSTDSRDQYKNLKFFYKKIVYVCVFMLASISAITAL